VGGVDDYEPKYEEFSFSSMVNDLLFIFNHSHPFEKERAGKNLRYWKKLAAEEAEQERKRKATDTIQHGIDIKKRTRARRPHGRSVGLAMTAPS
jgi:hypothetical protein